MFEVSEGTAHNDTGWLTDHGSADSPGSDAIVELAANESYCDS